MKDRFGFQNASKAVKAGQYRGTRERDIEKMETPHDLHVLIPYSLFSSFSYLHLIINFSKGRVEGDLQKRREYLLQVVMVSCSNSESQYPRGSP